MSKKKQDKVGIMLYLESHELYNKLKKEAEKEMRSVTNMANYILAQYLENKEK